MRNFKKFVALGLAVTMAMGTSLTASASSANGSSTASGGLEGYVDTDIFTVVLPTTQTVNFKLDPQELLLATGSSATLDSAALTAGYGSKILFTKEANFLSKSEEYAIVNLSTVDVNVAVNAKITGLNNATESQEADYDIKVLTDLTDVTDTAITLGLTSSTDTVTYASGSTTSDLTFTGSGNPTAGTTTALTADAAGVTANFTIPKIADFNDTYKVTGTTGSYATSLKEASALADTTYSQVAFSLAGTVNTAADWTAFNEESGTLTVNVTYTVSEVAEAAESVPAVSMWYETELWVAITNDEEGGITESNVSSVKIKDDTMSELADVEYRVDDTGWLCIDWDDIITAGGGESATSWTVEFVHDGTTYSTTNDGE